MTTIERKRPGEVRDAIVSVLDGRAAGASVSEITEEVSRLLGDVSPSSVRSYLQLKTPELFERRDRGQYVLAGFEAPAAPQLRVAGDDGFVHQRARLVLADCVEWLERQPAQSMHAVVTDPPYGLLEYSDREQEKLRRGKGGVWRIPPAFDGAVRSPLPRFTVLCGGSRPPSRAQDRSR